MASSSSSTKTAGGAICTSCVCPVLESATHNAQLTMDSRSLRGPDKITHMLNERLAKTGVKNIQLMDLPKPTVEFMGEDLAFITAHFKLEWALGTGSGMIRLAPTKAKSGTKEELADVNVWEIYHISTTMDTLQGINPDSGERVRDRRPKLLDPLGKARTYTQMREDEKECLHGFEPTVLIVGKLLCFKAEGVN
jgi:hypothetical protein